MTRFVCIHGHFYQPPRENPGLEEIELQDSAAPYHDWNERILAECYAPMAEARMLDEDGLICAIVNNYARMSFNFGATLLSWMERASRPTYDALLNADRESRERFSGHGSALAQAYHHAIMPLCNDRDLATQVRWGKADFRARFGRDPEGMWLPECAVDTRSLEALAAEGIAFTVLSPRQAARVRPGGGGWEGVEGAVDPRRAYRVRLPSGRSIGVFFYDGPVSQAVAFERLLESGERFSERLLGILDERDEPQLAHIATDGETYGHHHHFGEMALAKALDLIERGGAKLTNYGEFLERHPPTWEAEIVENSSWSCAHGVERWRSDCGCRAGGPPDWNQAWRAPLREALDLLRDAAAAAFERVGGELLRDPWAARDDYVALLLDPGDEARRDYLARHATRELSEREECTVFRLLEQQRHALHMYTSCGWFFDDLAGLETVQVLAYADRVLQLGKDTLDPDVEARFLDALAPARSNDLARGTGRDILLGAVRPRRVSLRKIAAHTAIDRLLDPQAAKSAVRGYRVERSDERELRSGSLAFVRGRIDVLSERTRERERLEYATVHLGGHSVAGGVRARGDDARFEADCAELEHAVDRGDAAAAIGALARFGEPWSLKDLMVDPQRRIVNRILARRVSDVEAALSRIFVDQRPLRRFLADLGVPLPEALKSAASFAVQSRLRAELSGDASDPQAILDIVREAGEEGIPLRTDELAHALRRNLETSAETFNSDPLQVDQLERLTRLTTLARDLPFPVDLWRVQNRCWRLLGDALPRVRAMSPDEYPHAEKWESLFGQWCRLLGVRFG